MGVFSDIMSNSTFLGPGMQPAYSPNPTEADRQKYNKVQRRRAYFDGLRGLQGGARADWEKRYLKQITGRDPYQQDQFFKNTVFKEIFKGSTDPEKQKIWNNRHDLTPDQRDLYVARDIVEDYDRKGGPRGILTEVAHNRQAMNVLGYESDKQANKYKEYLYSLSGGDRKKILDELDTISNATSSLYKKYAGTDKLNLSEEDKIDLLSKFQAWNEVGGSTFAQKALGEHYQNIVANNQSLWEKTINSGAQFIDSAVGMLIRAAGMVGAATTLGKEEGEGYWEHIIDNEVTRYGDRVATTNTYDPKEQEKLEKLGLSDNPIIGTVEQQESMLSANTPFELFGQYGFTTASTILSFGSSALVNATAKSAAWAAKVATASKGLNTTAKGVKFLRGVTRAKDIGNIAVVGGIGAVEGGMNAAQTKNEVLNGLNADIDDKYRQKAQEDIADQVRKDPQGAARFLRAKGYNVPERVPVTKEGKTASPYNEEEVNQMIGLLQGDESIMSAALGKYSKSITDDRIAAEKSAKTSMYIDFVGNSIINGFIHSTLQASLNAPSVQNTLRKFGLAKSPLEERGVEVVREQGKWLAKAKKYTKLNAFGNRLKESLGEGLEEYNQDLSSGFAQGYGEDKYRQYLNNKYAGSSVEDALDNDIASSFMAGLKSLGEAAISKQAIKDGLYGGLSTIMGGFNVNSHILNGTRKGERKEGESYLSYISRKSPIGWRSAFGPLISNSEVDAVNNRREELAKNINDFFSKPEVQESFFNVNSTSKWMRQLETAAENKDQMEVRNARLGVLFSNIATLNSLSGSGYYDAVIASLQARANLNEENLQDENSEESKLVAMYKQDALNRGQSVTDEEALHSIKSSASKMLETIDKVDKETEEVEKLYGEDLDKDVKAGLVFQRIAIEDAKNRMDKLNGELNSVTTRLSEEPSDVEASSRALNKSAKVLMARFGSLSTATTRLEELEKDRQDLKESLKSIKSDEKSAVTDEEKASLAQVRVMSERALKNTEKEYKELKSLISNYQSTAFTETNDRGEAVAADNQPISALDIMNLDAQSRATMLDPSNRENYSQKQQAEIDKVNRIGIQTYQDFAAKIQDSSRLALSYEASMQRQLEMMADPKSFMRVANSLKYEAQKRFLEKKYKYLLDFEEQGDYNSFARELDKIRAGNSVIDADAALDLLGRSNSEFLKRYYSEHQGLSNLFAELSKGQNEAYNNLDDNQKNVFYDTLKYLNNKGIDINDSNSVINALSEQDEQGNSLFEQYVNDVNENAREEAKSEFTSVGEAIQAYKDVMEEYNTSEQEKANNAKETPVAPTTSEQSAPPKAPSAQGPSLMEMGTATAEESAKRSQEADKEGVVEDPVTEAYKENSGQEIADLSKLAANSISNASSTTSNQESKNLALDEVRRLSDVKFDNVDDYADALLQSANKLDSQSEDDGDNEGRAASLLRAAATRVRARADESKRKSEEEKAKNKTPQDRKTNLAERKLTNPIRSAVNVNAALMDTIPIAWIRQNYPNSPLVKYYDNHRIEEFLETDFMSSKPAVMFITDPQLAGAVRADMESRDLEYTGDNIPLIAVVEVPTGGITIKVNGEDKHFQPIGIMPRTGNANSNGSNRLAAIRNLINNQELGQLIKDADGNIVTTTIGGNVIAEAPKQLPSTEPNRSAISLQINDLNEKEKGELQNLSKPDRRKSPIYWRIKQEFLKKLAIATPEGKGKYLYYALPNLKGQVIDVRVFTTPVNLTRDRNSNRLISELFNSNEVSAALNSNSRISRAAKELRKFFEKSFDTSEMYFETDDAGNIVPTESTAKKLNALSEQLTKTIGNFLSLPTRDGWKYVISPTSEVMEDGRRMFTLSLVNNEGSQIELGRVANGQMSENTQFNILKNLIMDGSSVRMVNNRESFVKWNVPYSDVQNMNSNKAAKDNISDIYDDGILDFSKDSLRYHIKGLSINSPFTMQGEANYTKQDEISSPTNAQPTTPLNQPVVAANDQVTTPKGTIVDSESGVVLGGESVSPTQSSTDVKPIVDSIVANSKIIQLSEDGKYYINTRTGKKYARVTSIIQADEHSDGRFDPNSPWITPSTNIGNGMDELVRDFFAGKLDNDIQAIEVQREMDEIKQKAIADGTFMKAPNGKKSNLTERQWLQVRTKAFKDWFGDWEKEYTPSRQYDLSTWERTGEYVNVLKKDPLGNTYSTSEEILSHPVERKETTKEDPFGFNSTGVSKAIKVGTLVNRLNPLNGICQFTAQRIQAFLKDRYGIDAHTNIIEAKSPVTEEIITHHVVALTIDGKPYIYDMPQTEFISTNGNTFNVGNKEYKEAVITKEYAPRLIEISKDSLLKNYGNTNDTQISVIKNTAKLSGNIKLSDIETNYIPAYSSDVSKVVDENGEPLVVYHATNKTFNTYKERDGIHFGSYNTALGVANEKFDPTFDTIEEAQASIAKGKFRINQEFLNIRNPKQSKDLGTGWKQLITEGFDGGSYMAVEGDTSFVVFNPNQIKSATDNIGTNTLESKYPNATRESLEKFVQQLTGLKNSLDAQGLTVVPRDVVATGSIEVTDSEGKKHTIDVAGTLDLLAYDGKGNFYIFDMKTHHSTNVSDKIDKWRRQLTLYKTFLESQYGINVKSLNIIPIKVEYPAPKGFRNSTNEFTVKEGNQLLLNGKEFKGANPNLGMTIALNPIELNVLFDNLTEEEKSQIRESEASQSEVGTVEKVDAKEEGDGSFIEPMTGLRKAKSKDLRRKKKGKGGAVKKPVERLTPVPAKYQWGKFEGATTSDGDTIDAKLATSNLEKAGYTEESWNQLSDEEMQHELDCKGI